MATSRPLPITPLHLATIGRCTWMSEVLAELRAAGFTPECRLLPKPGGRCFEFRMTPRDFPRLQLRLERENLDHKADGYVASLMLEAAGNKGPLLFRVDRIGLDILGASSLMEMIPPPYLVAAICEDLGHKTGSHAA